MGVREFLVTFAAAKQNFVTKDEKRKTKRFATKDEKRKTKRFATKDEKRKTKTIHEKILFMPYGLSLCHIVLGTRCYAFANIAC